MTKPYSQDLRGRVVASVEGAAGCREAAAQFSIGASSVVRRTQRFRQTGSVSAKPMGYGTVWRFFAKENISFKKTLPAAERNLDTLWRRIGAILPTVTPQECPNCFKADGYIPT